jgi:hypothetical protein
MYAGSAALFGKSSSITPMEPASFSVETLVTNLAFMTWGRDEEEVDEAQEWSCYGEWDDKPVHSGDDTDELRGTSNDDIDGAYPTENPPIQPVAAGSSSSLRCIPDNNTVRGRT